MSLNNMSNTSNLFWAAYSELSAIRHGRPMSDVLKVDQLLGRLQNAANELDTKSSASLALSNDPPASSLPHEPDHPLAIFDAGFGSESSSSSSPELPERVWIDRYGWYPSPEQTSPPNNDQLFARVHPRSKGGEGELKPCPFCGNTRLDIRDNGIGDSFVYCGVDDEETDTGCGARSGDYKCESDEQAAERWNTRTPSQVESEAAWRPIESAPRDGTPLILLVPHQQDYSPNFHGGLVWISSSHGKAAYYLPLDILPTPPQSKQG